MDMGNWRRWQCDEATYTPEISTSRVERNARDLGLLFTVGWRGAPLERNVGRLLGRVDLPQSDMKLKGPSAIGQ